MNRTKVIALLVILAGVGVSFLIAGGSSDERSENIFSVLPGGEKLNPSLDFKSIREPHANLSWALESPGEEGDTQETDNLTKRVAQNYAREFLKNIERGSGKINEQDINALTPNSIERVLRESAIQGFEFPKLELEDIKTSSNNSPQAQIGYIESIDTLLIKNFNGSKKRIDVVLEEFFKENDSQSLNHLIDNTPYYIRDLLELRAPDAFQFIHLQYVNVWQKKLVAYQAILNVQADPLKAYIIIQELPKILQEELVLKSVLTEHYEKLTS